MEPFGCYGLKIIVHGPDCEEKQTKYLVHGWDDVYWVETIDQVLAVIKKDLERDPDAARARVAAAWDELWSREIPESELDRLVNTDWLYEVKAEGDRLKGKLEALTPVWVPRGYYSASKIKDDDIQMYLEERGVNI